jgi:alpha-tubulin suppressor-like RCC1 family protein
LNAQNIRQIASVGYYTLALDRNGAVWAWGDNNYGQLGDGTRKLATRAIKVKNLPKIVAVATGWHHSMALDEAGRVWMWGDNPYGQLGLGDYAVRLLPTLVNGLPKIKKIACGSWHSMALDESGEVWAWGRNENGMLGNGDTTNSPRPVRAIIENVKDIGAGCFQSIAIRADDEIYVWGENWNGQLGLGHYERQLLPAKSILDLKGAIHYDPKQESTLTIEARLGLGIKAAEEETPAAEDQVAKSPPESKIRLFVKHNKKFLLSFALNIVLLSLLFGNKFKTGRNA